MKKRWYLVTHLDTATGEPLLRWPFHAQRMSAAFEMSDELMVANGAGSRPTKIIGSRIPKSAFLLPH